MSYVPDIVFSKRH